MSLYFRPRQKPPPWSALPALGWFLWFLLIPLGIVVVYSFLPRGIYGGVEHHFTLENYHRAMAPIYLKIFFSSLKLSSLTALSCLVLGFPMAYAMATQSKWVRNVLLMLVVIPFWTNFVIRAFAVKVLLAENGPLNAIALSLGIFHEPLALDNSQFAVWFGMVTNYLPFMVLPLYVSLEKFDFTLLEAGKDLGASSFSLLWRIIIPLNAAGIWTGLIFVFTPALGEFVIPDLLGGSRTMLIGNLVTEQFLKARDWPFGASLSLLLIITVMLSLSAYLRYADTGEPG